MAGFQAFDLPELRQARGERAYREILRRPGMSIGLYVLPVGGTDAQHPHAADEVYVVLGGKAILRVEDELVEVREGSVVSVDRGRDHRFTDISEELHVLVVFAPPADPDT
jgi:mannose-6-phosphate isomerase-like protein (cupin superfamily)